MVQPLSVRLMTEQTFFNKAQQQDTDIADALARVAALETLGGLAPGNISDATMADIAANKNSLFAEQLRYRKDTPSGTKTLFEIDHYGTAGFAYGLDIQNFPGANAALVLHQYSSAGNGAFVLDNTGTAPAIRIDNTENQTINPGSVGTGVFLRLSPYNNGQSARMDLRDDLMWDNASPHGHGVINTVGGVGFTVDQKIAAIGLHVKQATSLYGLRVDATDYAAYFVSTGTAGQAMTVRREGSAGTALRVDNLGTGWSAYFHNGTSPVGGIAADGSYERMTAGSGDIFRSADGSRFKVTMSNAGAFVITKL